MLYYGDIANQWYILPRNMVVCRAAQGMRAQCECINMKNKVRF